MTKKHRISAAFKDFIQLQVLKTRIIVNLCINLGWKGGNIFPIIFAGLCMGYALALLTGAEPVFAVAVCVSGLCGYIMRKPLTVIAVLLLCFPVTIILPVAAAAYVGSLVPVFQVLSGKKEQKRFTNTAK